MRLSLPIILFLIPSFLFSEEVDKNIHEECLYPTIGVVSDFAYGTGVVVRSHPVKDGYENAFITCAHIFKDSVMNQILVSKYKNWSDHEGYDLYPCYMEIIDQEKDYAVGVFKSKKIMHCVKINSKSLYIGNDILKVGCGAKEQPRIDYGKITATKMLVKDIINNGYRISACTIRGDSGGPVFTIDRKLIGLTKAVRTIVDQEGHEQIITNIAYVTPIDTISKNQAIKYVFDNKIDFPRLPFIFIKVSQFRDSLAK